MSLYQIVSVIKGEKRNQPLRHIGALSARKVWALLKKGTNGEKNINMHMQSNKVKYQLFRFFSPGLRSLARKSKP